jgi:hypothetical protein
VDGDVRARLVDPGDFLDAAAGRDREDAIRLPEFLKVSPAGRHWPVCCRRLTGGALCDADWRRAAGEFFAHRFSEGMNRMTITRAVEERVLEALHHKELGLQGAAFLLLCCGLADRNGLVEATEEDLGREYGRQSFELIARVIEIETRLGARVA